MTGAGPGHSVQSELGPTLQPRWVVQAKAREIRALADRAIEFAGDGPTADLGVALRQFDRMRAVLGDDGQRTGADLA